jgi:endonuclease-3
MLPFDENTPVLSTSYPIDALMEILEKVYPYHPMADVTQQEPFKVLICCLLSIRSPDRATMPVCGKLFRQVQTPADLIAMSDETLGQLIRPVQFWQGKVGTLKHVCHELLTRFDGQVPDTREALLSIRGVGPKTASLVLSMGFGLPAISVDTHVHRICNRLGYVLTRTPEATQEALEAILPRRYWNTINRVLVRHGQDICVANFPKCDICPVSHLCQQVGVTPRKAPRFAQPRTVVPRNTAASWGIESP